MSTGLVVFPDQPSFWFSLEPYGHVIILHVIKLTAPVGKRKRILSADWVPEWTRSNHFARLGFPTLIMPKEKIGSAAFYLISTTFLTFIHQQCKPIKSASFFFNVSNNFPALEHKQFILDSL